MTGRVIYIVMTSREVIPTEPIYIVDILVGMLVDILVEVDIRISPHCKTCTHSDEAIFHTACKASPLYGESQP